MKPKKKPVKTRWSASSSSNAMANLKMLKACILAGEVKYHPDTVTFKIPSGIANFLIDAVTNIQNGADVAASFGLVEQRGAPSKRPRDALLAIEARRTKTPLIEVAEKFGCSGLIFVDTEIGGINH